LTVTGKSPETTGKSESSEKKLLQLSQQMAHPLHKSAGRQNGHGRVARLEVAAVKGYQPGTPFPQRGYENREVCGIGRAGMRLAFGSAFGS